MFYLFDQANIKVDKISVRQYICKTLSFTYLFIHLLIYLFIWDTQCENVLFANS